MAYNEFAYYYDEFNTAADYDALYRYVTGELAACGVTGGLLADFGLRHRRTDADAGPGRV